MKVGPGFWRGRPLRLDGRHLVRVGTTRTMEDAGAALPQTKQWRAWPPTHTHELQCVSHARFELFPLLLVPSQAAQPCSCLSLVRCGCKSQEQGGGREQQEEEGEDDNRNKAGVCMSPDLTNIWWGSEEEEEVDWPMFLRPGSTQNTLRWTSSSSLAFSSFSVYFVASCLAVVQSLVAAVPIRPQTKKSARRGCHSKGVLLCCAPSPPLCLCVKTQNMV